jgi:hypothetical protein
MDQAFTLLRDRARASNRRLSDLARAFIDGTQALAGPDPAAPASHPPRPATRPQPERKPACASHLRRTSPAAC